MRCGDPDPRRGVHGLQQIISQFAQRAVEDGHGLRRQYQAWVGITDDRVDGHDRLICARCLNSNP